MTPPSFCDRLSTVTLMVSFQPESPGLPRCDRLDALAKEVLRALGQGRGCPSPGGVRSGREHWTYESSSRAPDGLRLPSRRTA